MAQMFISPLVIRAFRTLDDAESFDDTEEVQWYIIREDTGERLHGPYPTYDTAIPVYRRERLG